MPPPAPSDPPPAPVRHPVHAVATAGNAVFVTFLALLLTHDRLFTASPPADSPPAESPSRLPCHARRVVLIVVDGLRADVAADPRSMPALDGLRQRGRSGTVRVDSLIPSTIAGVVALATGSSPAPAAVFQDFRALPAAEGGIFQRVKEGGGGCFVAGPRLWGDLYGRWIDRLARSGALVHADDSPLVDAATGAMASDRFRLIVVHLGGPDDAAHAAGTRSREYAAAVRRADEALGRLLTRARGDDLVVVTADHGNTVAGGHAGPEPDVINVPLVIAGADCGTGDLPVRRQAEIARLLADCLGLAPAPPADSAAPRAPVLPLALTLLCCACGLWICGATGRDAGTRLQPTLLNTSLWPALLLAAFGHRGAAGVIVILALLGASAAGGAARGIRRGSVAAAAAGAVVAVLRLAEGAAPTWSAPAARTAASSAAVVAAYATGRAVAGWLRRDPDRAPAAGALAAVAVVAAGRIAGQTLSLSTLDVRFAYPLAAHAATLPLAVVAVMLLHAAPALAVVAALRDAARRLAPAAVAAFAAGAAATLIGQLLVFSVVLAASPDTTPAALAVGGLLRTAAEGTYVFLALAAVVVAARRAT